MRKIIVLSTIVFVNASALFAAEGWLDIVGPDLTARQLQRVLDGVRARAREEGESRFFYFYDKLPDFTTGLGERVTCVNIFTVPVEQPAKILPEVAADLAPYSSPARGYYSQVAIQIRQDLAFDRPAQPRLKFSLGRRYDPHLMEVLERVSPSHIISMVLEPWYLAPGHFSKGGQLALGGGRILESAPVLNEFFPLRFSPSLTHPVNIHELFRPFFRWSLIGALNHFSKGVAK